MASKSGSWSIGWVSFSYSTSWGKTTYNVWGKSYSSAQSAANAIKSSSWYDSSKWLVRWSSSSSWWSSSSSSSSSSKSGSSGWTYFVDPSVLQDQHMGMSNEDIAKKWWWTDASWNSWSSTAWWTKVLQALNKNNRVYWTGWYTEYNASTWLYSKPSSSSKSSSSSTSTQNDVVGQYWDASYRNYTNAYNNYKSKWMSDSDARREAAKLLENEDLLKTKSDEDIAIETQKNEEDERDPMDVINDIYQEWDEEYEDNSEEFDELIWDWADEYERKIADLESQLESNTVKTSVPEERDTSYDYNTYYKENLAPDNNYENWESKNTLNEEPQTTLVSQYQEPVTTALNDLGLLTPDEEMAAETPNVEEATIAKPYNSWDEIVADFADTLDNMGSEWWTWLSPQAVAQTYVDFRNQLDAYAKNNKLTPEEYDALLSQLKQNETLQGVLKSNQQ